jgi:hypothetical protein
MVVPDEEVSTTRLSKNNVSASYPLQRLPIKPSERGIAEDDMRNAPSSCLKPVLVGFIVLALSSGCSHTIYTPPGRFSFLENTRATHARDVGVNVSYSHMSVPIWGPDADSVNLHGRYAVVDKLEGSADLGLMRFAGATRDRVDKNVYAGRIGLAYALLPVDAQYGALIVSAGFGGGSSAAGSYVSVDGNVALAIENKYFVPSVTGHLYASWPVSRRYIDTTGVEEESNPGDTSNVDTLHQTRGLGVTAAVKLPLDYVLADSGALKGIALTAAFTYFDLRRADGEHGVAVVPTVDLGFVF